MPPPTRGFDVEAFRAAGRTVVIRRVDRPTLVLGSTQRRSVVNAERAARRGVAVVRRRSGGGAVLLEPGAQIWADLWVPRGDPLWSDEPRQSAIAAGEWWARALRDRVPRALSVHEGGSVHAEGAGDVCFGGAGPGEVLADGRKVVGLAQWRSREGALVHGCAYRHWDPRPIVDLLDLGECPGAQGASEKLLCALVDAAAGLADLGATGFSEEDLLRALPGAPAGLPAAEAPGRPTGQWTIVQA